MSKQKLNFANMTRGELKDQAKQVLAGKWNALALIVFVYFLLNVVLGMVPLVATVASIILFPMTIALIAIAKNVAEGKEQKIENLFDFYKDLGLIVKIFVAYLLMIVAVIIGLFLFIIPGIIVMLGLSQIVFVFLEDPEIGIIDSLKRSWELMNGYKWEYFVLMLSFLGWGILAVLTCFIGFLWLMPYMNVTYYLFYKKITA